MSTTSYEDEEMMSLESEDSDDSVDSEMDEMEGETSDEEQDDDEQTDVSYNPLIETPDLKAESQNQQVNCTLLDHLVLDFLAAEGILDFTPNQTPPQDDERKITIEQQKILYKIRSHILEGNILDALQLASSIVPKIVENEALLFKLHVQNFIERLRKIYQNEKNEVEMQKEKLKVLEYCKEVIVPIAMDAYPNAYNDFKSILPLLIFDQSVKDVSCAQLWSLSRREEVALELHDYLVRSLGGDEPLLSLIVRYLLPIHNMHHIIKGLTTPFPIIEKLILPDFEPQEPYIGEIIPVSEYNVQQLCMMLSIPQNVAETALMKSGNDLEKALKSELCRMKIDRELIISLVLQYCTFRGLLHHQSINTYKTGYSPEDSTYLTKLRKIREAFTSGDMNAVISHVNDIDPHYFEENPSIYFKIKQQEFLREIKASNFEKALEIAYKELAPITEKQPELIASFKDTIILLGFPNLEDLKDFDFERKIVEMDIAGSLYSDLSKKIGLVEPDLLVILRYLLYTHTAYFEFRQSDDRFEKTFQIDKLKNVDQTKKEEKEKQSVQSEVPLIEDEEDNGEFDSNTVSTLMEILNIPRREAVFLLRQNDGNLEAVINGLFS